MGEAACSWCPTGATSPALDAALTELLGAGHHVVLTAGAGPARRYREFLAVSRGTRRIVVGTRAAAFAPVHDLGLVAIWDDGDDLHAEPRAPYPHAREVLLTRAQLEDAAALVGGFARSVEAEQLLATGLGARDRALRARRSGPRSPCPIAGATDLELERDPLARATRMPKQVHDAVAAGLWRAGPVLVQTPRRGYAASLACERCRTPARCAVCTGPAGGLRARRVPPACRWCGTVVDAWACADVRPPRAPGPGGGGAAYGRGAGPGLRLHAGRGLGRRPRRRVGAGPAGDRGGDAGCRARGRGRLRRRRPARHLARPGAARPAHRGGGAAPLAAARPGWSRPVASVVAVGDPAHPALQALVRWDPAGFAQREAAARAEAHLPPASRLATITGEPGAVDDALTLLDRPPGTEVLGPVEVDDGASRLVVRVPRAHGPALSRALGEVQRVRSARKLDAVRIQVDPMTLAEAGRHA